MTTDPSGTMPTLVALNHSLIDGGYLTPGGQVPGQVPNLGTPGTSSSKASSDDPFVYLGHSAPVSGYEIEGSPYPLHGHDYHPAADETATVSQMFDNLDHMSVKEQHKLLGQLLVAGYSSSTVDLDKIADAVKNSSFADLTDSYTRFLQDLSDRYSTRGQKITPDELLKQRIAYRFKAAGVDWNGNINNLNLNSLVKLGGGQVDQSGTKTATYTSKDFMDPMDAKALTRATLQRELGRDPTQAEYEDFLASLHAAEAHDPSRRTETTTTDAQGRIVSQNSVTHQGMTSEGISQLATEKAQRQPDWAEFQAMGTYAPVLYSSLDSAVPGT